MIKIWNTDTYTNFPANKDEWSQRMREISALIPQPQKRERGNNINFVIKAFDMLSDCGILTRDTVEKLNDKNWCDSKISVGIPAPPCKMNPLGGILRKQGLTMWDKTSLRYYCPQEDLILPSDIETSKKKLFKGATKLAVLCDNDYYYISNDWFSTDKPRPTKDSFYFWIALVTGNACEKYWKQRNEEKISISASDLNFIFSSLKNLNEKIDSLANQVADLKAK